MDPTPTYSLSRLNGQTLEDTPLAEDILALDRRNMAAFLQAVGREFPAEKRKATLFAPSNQIIIARAGPDLAGYVDYCDDPDHPGDVYLSSIQIDERHRHGLLFRALVTGLLTALGDQPFTNLRTHVQSSNERMVAIMGKAGFTLEDAAAGRGTLAATAPRDILQSSRFARWTGD